MPHPNVPLTVIFLVIVALSGVGVLTALVQSRTFTVPVCLGILACVGWLTAAALTPPPELEGVDIHLTPVTLSSGTEVLAVCRHPGNSELVVWRHKGKIDEHLKAYFPDNSRPRLGIMGMNAPQDKPRIVSE